MTDVPRRRRWPLRLPLLMALLLALVTLIVQQPSLQNALSRSVQTLATSLNISPRAIYVLRLRLSGLDDTEAGRRWLNALARARKQPLQVDRNPFVATDAFTARQALARVYVFTAQRGQQIELTLHRPGTRDTQLFAALYRRNEGDDAWRLVEPLRDGNSGATILVDTDATYRLELQPELLADIDYELIISRGGSLPFPVVDASTRDIGSVFGDARDAGAREHHGVDIFAARGTPVRAVMAGTVRNGNSERGGLHVWLSSGFGSANHYYAHLDDTAVASGERVAAGDVIGYVGNTGNARGTPPHLHYGIYLRGVGPVDPAPYIQAPPPLPAATLGPG